jgi:hypothetical protein
MTDMKPRYVRDARRKSVELMRLGATSWRESLAAEVTSVDTTESVQRCRAPF